MDCNLALSVIRVIIISEVKPRNSSKPDLKKLPDYKAGNDNKEGRI